MASRRQQAAQRAVNAQAKRNSATKQHAKQAKPATMKTWTQSDRQSLVSAPSAQGHIQLGSGPMFMATKSNSSGMVRIKHREYITDLITNGTASTFSVQQFLPINPGMASTFPWLSGVANKFETYRFRSLRFLLESQVPTSTSGAQFMAIDFDAADAQPLSKQQLMTYKTSVRSPIWTDCCCQPNQDELHKLGPERYVRQGALAANLDIRTADLGNLAVASVSSSSSLLYGELYVEYDVELITPLFEPSVQAVAASGKFASGTVSGNNSPFSPAASLVETGGIGVLPNSAGSGLGFLEAGEYIVIVEATGTGFSSGTLPTLAAVGNNAVTMLSATQNNNPAGTASTVYFAVRCNTPSVLASAGIANVATFTLGYGVSPALTSTVTRIAPYGYVNA